MATGSEILSYRPDARLAGGLNETPQGTGADILNPFNNTMQQLASQRFQWDVNRYQQGIKDRDEILKLVKENNEATQGIDLLDQDKKVLEGKLSEANQKILDTVKQYGNPKSNLTAYAAIQKDIKDYQQAVQSAKTRAIMGKDLLTKAADETNQLDRNAMLQHYTKEFQQSDVNHLPQPYFKRFKYDASLVAPDVKEEQVGKKYDGDYEVVTKATPLQAFRYNIDAINTGTDNAKNLIQHQQTMYQDAINGGLLSNPDYVKQVNAKLDQFNNTFGLKPGDYDYAKPLGEVDADGNVINPVNSPAEFARDMHILGKFKQSQERAISKDVIALKNARTERALKGAQISNIQSEIHEREAKLSHEIEKIDAETEKAKQGNKEVNAMANGYASQVVSAIKQGLDKPVVSAIKQGLDKPVDNSILNARQKLKLGFSENAEVRKIPVNEAILQIGTSPVMGENTSSGAEVVTGRMQPKKAFLINDNGKYSFFFPKVDKDGREGDISEGKIVPAGAAVGEILNHKAFYKGLKDKETEAAGLGFNIVENALSAIAPNITQQQSAASQSENALQQIKSGKAKPVTDPETGNVYYQVGNDFYDSKGNIVQ